MTAASKGNQQIIEVERILTTAVAPQSDAEIVAHSQAILTLALVREQRTANLIAYFAANGATPPKGIGELIEEALGVERGES